MPRPCPQGTLAERLRAAGAGIPAFYTPTAVGTELAEGRETRVINGREYLLEYALPCDVALLRCYQADEAGNLRFRRAQRNFGPIMAMASKLVIVEVEEPILPAGAIDPDEVHTPGILVHRLVHIPPAPDGDLADAEGDPLMPWSRTQIAERLAREFQDGWIINLGVGMPTLITDVPLGDREVFFHAENGVIGFGPVAAEGQEDIHLVDASRPLRHAQPWRRHRRPRRQLRAHPRRPHRRHRARQLRGRGEWRLRQLEGEGLQGRRASAARWTSRPVRRTSS